MNTNISTAFAPATCANVAVGYDLLGFPFDSVGDTVTVKKVSDKRVTIKSISGIAKNLPLSAEKNTAGIVLLELIKKCNLNFGFEIEIKKGIPVGSGMGGSAASSVAALVAANVLIPSPLEKLELLELAFKGEELASGAAHADNAAPCMLGGFNLVRSLTPLDVISLPLLEELKVILIHPEIKIETKMARQLLGENLPLKDFVSQSANLAGFISGIYTKDFNLIKRSLKDVLIEPRRESLIPGLRDCQKKAMELGALGCSISGSGPSIFALTIENEVNIKSAREEGFKKVNIEAQAWCGKISKNGARII